MQERDKLYLSRSVIFELVQALKFKSPLPDENLLMLVQVRGCSRDCRCHEFCHRDSCTNHSWKGVAQNSKFSVNPGVMSQAHWSANSGGDTVSCRVVQFVCIDSGGTIGPINISEELSNAVYNPYNQSLISTNAAECMKQNLSDCVEFISDLHTINKVKVRPMLPRPSVVCVRV